MKITKIKLTRGWDVSFEITPFGTVSGWSNIMHATTGGDDDVYGARTPGIWFISGTTKLRICSAINGDKTYCLDSDPIPLNKESKIIVQQIQAEDGGDQYYFKFFINDKKVKSVLNTQPKVFYNVTYYTSSPWYQPAKAKINNFKLELFNHKGESSTQNNTNVIRFWFFLFPLIYSKNMVSSFYAMIKIKLRLV